jgi:hypothetical protein
MLGNNFDIAREAPKLKTYGLNWFIYRDRMAWMLAAYGLEDHLTNAEMPTGKSYAEAEIVDGETATNRWKLNDAIVKRCILGSLPDPVFSLMKEEPRAKAIWDKLKADFENGYRIRMARARLERRLLNQRCGDEQDVRAHIAKLGDLREQLVALGKFVPDDEYSWIILNSLPPAYDSCITVIRSVLALKKMELDPVIVARIIIEDYDRRMLRKSESKATRNGTSSTTARKKNNGRR